MGKTIQQRIFTILTQEFEIEEEELSRDVSLLDDLRLSPAQLTDLLTDLESEFTITIPTDEIKNLDTIGALIDFIEDALDEL